MRIRTNGSHLWTHEDGEHWRVDSVASYKILIAHHAVCPSCGAAVGRSMDAYICDLCHVESHERCVKVSYPRPAHPLYTCDGCAEVD